MTSTPLIPESIAGIAVPQDRISAATWAWAHARLPGYLLAHSVRSYCWGASIGMIERLPFEPRILWAAALIHDVGLTRIPRNDRCFEFQGGAIARRFLSRSGMAAADADRVAVAIELHMAPTVTLADGAESVLLDRATGLDVRGSEYELVAAVRPDVMRSFPRGDFDRHFLAAIRREVDARPAVRASGCSDGPTWRRGWPARRGQRSSASQRAWATRRSNRARGTLFRVGRLGRSSARIPPCSLDWRFRIVRSITHQLGGRT